MFSTHRAPLLVPQMTIILFSAILLMLSYYHRSIIHYASRRADAGAKVGHADSRYPISICHPTTNMEGHPHSLEQSRAGRAPGLPHHPPDLPSADLFWGRALYDTQLRHYNHERTR